jgi:hypothetical protein
LPSDFLLSHDMSSVFGNGFAVLHQRVVLHAARGLVDVLRDLHPDDADIDDDVRDLEGRLRIQLEEGTPWRERDHLDVIAALDSPAWMAILGLIDECPSLLKDVIAPAGGNTPQRISSAHEFIQENRQIERIRAFVGSLRDRLG